MFRYCCFFFFLGFCLNSRPLVAQRADADTIRPKVSEKSPRNHRQRARTFLQSAKARINEGRTAEAERLLTQAISLRHDLSEAYLLRAGLKRKADNLRGAIVDYSVVIHQEPEHYEVRFERAQTRYEAQQYDQARDDFQYLLQATDGVTNAVFFRGTTEAGEFTASSATTLQSDMKADLLNYLGLCYWHTQDYARAEAYFTQATAHSPQEPLGYVNLGLTYEASGDTLRAIRLYQQALQIAPSHSVALRNLSALARQRSDTTLQKELLAPHEGESYDVRLQKGIYHHQLGDYPTAVRFFTQALERYPRSTEARLQRAFSYEKAGQLQEAQKDYTWVIRQDPTVAKAYSNRGNTYFYQEKYTEAMADYHQALALDPANATVLLNRGLTYHRQGEKEKACADLKLAANLGNQAAAKPLAKLCGDY